MPKGELRSDSGVSGSRGLSWALLLGAVDLLAVRDAVCEGEQPSRSDQDGLCDSP